MIDRDRCRRFAWALARLDSPEESSRKPDLGTLAHLRRGVGKEFGEASIRDGWVLHTLEEIQSGDSSLDVWTDRDIEWACCVASLFAGHRGVSSYRFGAAFRSLWHRRSEAPSVARRFTTLLDADERDLGTHLRHAVSLLRAEDIGLNWAELLFDVVRWNDADRRVQRRWSRDFWLDVSPKRVRIPNPQK